MMCLKSCSEGLVELALGISPTGRMKDISHTQSIIQMCIGKYLHSMRPIKSEWSPATVYTPKLSSTIASICPVPEVVHDAIICASAFTVYPAKPSI